MLLKALKTGDLVVHLPSKEKGIILESRRNLKGDHRGITIDLYRIQFCKPPFRMSGTTWAKAYELEVLSEGG